MADVDSSQRYLAAARGRPEWTLWGKARAEDGFVVPAHPLICHMTDVAVVAEALLASAIPPSSRARLLELVGGESDEALRWLLFVVALHDLGKATPPFQAKWTPATPWLADAGFDVQPPPLARDHGTLGVAFVADALVGLGVDALHAQRLGRAVAAHHGAFPTDHDALAPCVGREAGRQPSWASARAAIVTALAHAFGIDRARPPVPRRPKDWAGFSALAGFTSVADWIGSMAEVFVYEPPPDSVEAYLPLARERAATAVERCGFRPATPTPARSFEELFGFAPRPLQSAIADLLSDAAPPVCIVVEAPMGEGKTEAALYVSHALEARRVHDGAYLGLPTQATASQMFNRLGEFLERTRPDQRTNLQLLHGEAVFDARVQGLLRAVYARDDDRGRGGLVCEPWFLGKKRALLAPFGAGTVDQALLGVLRTKHAFVRQFGLSGKTVILDEVHAYDTYTSTLLERLVAWLGGLGASVVLLSATLPSDRRKALLESYAGRPMPGPEPAPYPRITSVDAQTVRSTPIVTGRPKTTIEIDWVADDDTVVREAARLAVAGANVGILRNTVARAQKTYAPLRELCPDRARLLLHARFPAEDRQRLEELLLSMLGKNGSRPTGSIVVGTQVLEQSLDIDFDALFTDVAPVDLVLQRAGRLHRHARASRPAVAAQPALRIVVPEGDPAAVSLRDIAPVYEGYVVRRSLLTLRTLSRITLPDDIERLVEDVFAAPEPPAWADALRREREKMAADRAEDQQLAKVRVWPAPGTPDDPFGDLDMPFEEDEPDVARMLRAETRLGEDTAEIVCLFGDDSRAFLERARARPVDLSTAFSAMPPQRAREVVRSLARRTVRVATRGLVPKLRALPVPASWREVSLLERRRPVFFGSAPVAIDRFTLDLDEELGLLIQRTGGRPDGVPADD